MKIRAGAWMTLAVILSGSVSGKFQAHAQSPQPGAKQTVEMRDHYGSAIAMHTAVIRGDLTEVAAAAQALTQYPEPPGTPPRASSYVATIRQEAVKAAAAPDVVVAAVSSAVMLNACAQCHVQAGVHAALASRPSPSVGGVVGHMLEHQRAADLIFQGLVLPSDSLWREGTRAFAAAPLHPSNLPVGALEKRRMTQTEEQLHRVASDAAQATDPRARASYYGQLLSGCADCHSRSKKWGPP